jgi:hypothetical protein
VRHQLEEGGVTLGMIFTYIKDKPENFWTWPSNIHFLEFPDLSYFGSGSVHGE